MSLFTTSVIYFIYVLQALISAIYYLACTFGLRDKLRNLFYSIRFGFPMYMRGLVGA